MSIENVSIKAGPSSQTEQFFTLLRDALAENSFIKLVLSKYIGAETDLTRVLIKEVTLRNEACLSFVYRFKTKDITKNFPIAAGIETLRELLKSTFMNAHLLTLTEEIQLIMDKKGKGFVKRAKTSQVAEMPSKEHNREKKRFLDLNRPFLMDLGVTNSQHQLIPSMSAKWKQINKFIEIFSNALTTSSLAAEKSLRVVDFGSGKGYLTFAVHDYLTGALKIDAQVTGVELREDLVELCNDAASRLKQGGLRFQEGDIKSYAPESIHVMIALHACDTATDYAIHMGIRLGAGIIMCSPCCHKQIRPQIQTPKLLRPILQHGVHLGEEAEMVTDSIRALLLESCGYEAKVFEFISLEHTNKNKMILAVKRSQLSPQADLLAQLDELKKFYGIREHCLEQLLQADKKIVAS